MAIDIKHLFSRPGRSTWCIIVVFVCLVFILSNHTYNKIRTPRTFPHPVELLHEHAKLQFQQLVERQSSTPEEAETAYRARYGREPPPGFRDWVEYALESGSPIIDDFDIIDEGVAPFYNMTPQHIVDLIIRGVTISYTQKGDPYEMCLFKDGKFVPRNKYCPSTWTPNIMVALGDAAPRIPDISMMFYFPDEPTSLPSSLDDLSAIQWHNFDHQPIGHLVKKACDNVGRRKAKKQAQNIETFGLPFVVNVDEEKDMCAHPEYVNTHGLFISPDTFRHMPIRVPSLSASAPYPFADILFPSPQYTEKKNRHDPKSDIEWEDKENLVYWAGATSGSHGTANETTWRASHRQRLVAMATNKEPRNFTYLEDSLGSYKPYESTLNESLYHVRITGALQCDKEACAAQKAYFGDFKYENLWASNKYRYLIDIDGNAYTNRFYRLLGSGSVIVKSTIFREWHDDRLIPWLHYIPLSQSFEELPELINFLINTESGQRISHDIAKAGQAWSKKAVSTVEQGIYLYRLMLELAWLQNSNRVLSNQ